MPGKTSSSDSGSKQERNDFSRQAEESAPGLIAEFRDFLVHNRKWWLLPIILVLLLVGLLLVLSGSVAAPFIYPIF